MRLLAAAILSISIGTLAEAQTLSCLAQAVDTPPLRDNGVTERVDEVKIICTGGTPTQLSAPPAACGPACP